MLATESVGFHPISVMVSRSAQEQLTNELNRFANEFWDEVVVKMESATVDFSGPQARLETIVGALSSEKLGTHAIGLVNNCTELYGIDIDSEARSLEDLNKMNALFQSILSAMENINLVMRKSKECVPEEHASMATLVELNAMRELLEKITVGCERSHSAYRWLSRATSLLELTGETTSGPDGVAVMVGLLAGMLHVSGNVNFLKGQFWRHFEKANACMYPPHQKNPPPPLSEDEMTILLPGEEPPRPPTPPPTPPMERFFEDTAAAKLSFWSGDNPFERFEGILETARDYPAESKQIVTDLLDLFRLLFTDTMSVQIETDAKSGVKKIFDEVDEDRSGRLNKEEFGMVAAKITEMPAEGEVGSGPPIAMRPSTQGS
jgi:hypothetical protein